MHAFRQFIQQQMDDATPPMTQADLVRRSRLSRSQISRLLGDHRDRMPKSPEQKTIDGLAAAFGGGSAMERRLWLKVAEAMGLPVGSEVVTANAADLTDEELVREIGRRLTTRQSAKPQLHVVVDPNKIEDPEDYNKSAALHESEPAGPPDHQD